MTPKLLILNPWAGYKNQNQKLPKFKQIQTTTTKTRKAYYY